MKKVTINEELFKEIIEKETLSEFEMSDKLAEADVDSIDLLVILIELEERLNFTFEDDEKVRECKTFQELYDLVKEQTTEDSGIEYITSNPVVVRHIKTGNRYILHREDVINATNALGDQVTCLYSNEAGEQFVRERNEFWEKFEVIS